MLGREGISENEITLRRFIDARYTGQVYEIETPVGSVEKIKQDHLKEILRDFEDAHERLNHYRMAGFPIEFVSCRVEAVVKVPPIIPKELPFEEPDPRRASKGKRKAYLPDLRGFEEVDTYDGEKLKHGNVIDGAAIVETEGSTLVVWKNQRLVVNRYGDFEIEVEQEDYLSDP